MRSPRHPAPPPPVILTLVILTPVILTPVILTPVILTKVRTQSQAGHRPRPWVLTFVRMTEPGRGGGPSLAILPRQGEVAPKATEGADTEP